MHTSEDLRTWGATDRVLAIAHDQPHLTLARVISQERGQYTVVTERDEQPAVVSGKIMHMADDPLTYPAVGDWVLIAGDTSLAVIQDVIGRTTSLQRKAAGTDGGGQMIAANVDIVFICMAMNEDFNLRRLERYLAVVWDSGATPMVVLTKADLAADLPAMAAEVTASAPGAEVIVTATVEDRGMDDLRAHLAPGRTIAFIGSSGVGKSTLVNMLVGRDVFRTSGLRGDGQGRHTTTHREAILLPDAGILIDTPGMRELGLDAADVGRAFSDIDELTTHCRFADCRHESEPGCAVREAIDRGDLDEARFASYQKLQREAKYATMNSRQIGEYHIDRIFGGKAGMKTARRAFQSKEKRRST